MLDIDLTEITQELEVESLTFSYVLKKSLLPDGISLILQQQETGFSLTIQLKEIDETLSVTKFSLTEESNLEQKSLSLYDTAIVEVEIVLQALDLLFIIADHADASEIALPSQKMRQCIYPPSPAFLMCILLFKPLREIMMYLLIKQKY